MEVLWWILIIRFGVNGKLYYANVLIYDLLWTSMQQIETTKSDLDIILPLRNDVTHVT